MLRQALAFWFSMLAGYSVVQAATPTGTPVVDSPHGWAGASLHESDEFLDWAVWQVTSTDTQPATATWSYTANDNDDFHVTLQDVSFSPPRGVVTDQSTGNGTTASWNLPALTECHLYVLQVAAASGGVDGPLSDEVYFYAGPVHKPALPTIDQIGTWDESQYSNAPANPTMTWTPVAGATGYHIKFVDFTWEGDVVNNADVFVNISDLPVDTNGKMHWTPPSELLTPTVPLGTSFRYAFILGAQNDFGYSLWPDSMSFTVGPASAPAAPVAFAPASPALTNPTIMWHPVDGAYSYYFGVEDLTTGAWVLHDQVWVWPPQSPPATDPITWNYWDSMGLQCYDYHRYAVYIIAFNDYGWSDWGTSGYEFYVGSNDAPNPNGAYFSFLPRESK